ncbi:MAG: hypothetical protein RR540_08100 [Oscillospiraceae bacterium]
MFRTAVRFALPAATSGEWQGFVLRYDLLLLRRKRRQKGGLADGWLRTSFRHLKNIADQNWYVGKF